jgi:phospholipase C
VRLKVANVGSTELRMRAKDNYSGMITTETIRAGGDFYGDWNLTSSRDRYDLVVSVVSDPTFRQQLAGHIENGDDSYTDAAMRNPAPVYSGMSRTVEPSSVV